MGLRNVDVTGLPTKNMTNDDHERLLVCLRVLSLRMPTIVDIFTLNCRQALSTMLTAKAEEEATTLKVCFSITKEDILLYFYVEIKK